MLHFRIESPAWNKQYMDRWCKRLSNSRTRPCVLCIRTSNPVQSRKISLSSLSMSFNGTVCINHFYIDVIRLFHAMDTSLRFSVASIVSVASLNVTVTAFEGCWLSQFWPLIYVLRDNAINKETFRTLSAHNDIQFKAVPALRRSKNPTKS